MTTAICKITFHDGSWVKAELPTDASQVQYAYDNFGMFASIEVLLADDAAVIAHSKNSDDTEVFYLIAWVDECAYGPMPSREVAVEYAAEISLWDGSFEVRNNPNGYYVKAPSAAFLGAHV